MSGLFSSLNSTTMALSAQSRAIEISGKNLANVNNSSYARQRVILGNRGTVQTATGPEAMGLEALSVEQIRDSLLDTQVTREISLSSSINTTQSAYSRAQADLGQTIDASGSTSGTSSSSSSGGLSASLDNFFNGFASVASLPTDPGERQSLIQTANILTSNLQQTDARLAQVQSDLNGQIGQDVSSANTLLTTIANLNAQIGRFENGNPGSAVDLRDQRQASLEKLAAYLPIETRAGTNGEIQVVMKDASNADVVLVDQSTVTGPVAFTGTGLTAGAASTAVVLNGGSIRGALDARDGAIQNFRDNLDSLAKQLVTTVNGIYNPSATPGSNFFDPAGTTAGTIAVQSGVTAANLVAGSGAAGDNSIALGIAALGNQTFSVAAGDPFDGTMGQHLGSAVSDLGQALATATSQASDQSNIEQLVRNQRDGVSGVSLDEEMSSLVQFQRAYQASSRVFTVVNDLLDTVVNHLGIG